MSVLREHRTNLCCKVITAAAAAAFWPCLCASLACWIFSGLACCVSESQKTKRRKEKNKHNGWLTTRMFGLVWAEKIMNWKKKKRKRCRAACGHVYMARTRSYTVTALWGLKKNPPQFLVHCLILSNKYLTLYLQQGHPELMAVVNTAGLSPAEGQAEVMSWPWPLLQMSFSFPAEPNNDSVSVWRRKAVNSSASCNYTWPSTCCGGIWEHISCRLCYDPERSKQRLLKLTVLKRAARVCPALLNACCDAAAFNYLSTHAALRASLSCSHRNFLLSQLF